MYKKVKETRGADFNQTNERSHKEPRKLTQLKENEQINICRGSRDIDLMVLIQ